MSFFKSTFLVSALTLIGVSVNKVYAQDFLPDPIRDLFDLLGDDGSGTAGFVSSRIQQGLLIGLAVIILFAVVYAAFAALKYIRSQGDPGQIEEAGKATRAIFYGIAVLLIAIVGIVLIFVFFGAGFFNTEIYQVCLNAPNSQGCFACNEAGLPSGRAAGAARPNWDVGKFNTGNPYSFTSPVPVGGGTTNEDSCGFCEWEYLEVSRDPAKTVENDVSAECKE